MRILKESRIPNIIFVIAFKALFILGKYNTKLRGIAFFLMANKRFPSRRFKTFNDVIYRRKIDLWDMDLSRYADKLRVRDFVAKTVGEEYLVPIQGVYDHWTEIDPDSLTYPCVLKSNHAQGQVIFLDSRDDFTEARLTPSETWFERDYFRFGGEPTYRGITPKLYIEDRINTPEVDLKDYKFQCFGGVIKSVTVDMERFTGHKRCHYSREWEKQDFTLGLEFYPGAIERPANYETMVEIAEKLAAPFKYIRIDLYNFDGRIYFGEMTFFHGNACSQNSSEYWDKWLIDNYRAVADDTNLI